MTNEEAISMVEAKLECLQRSTSGTNIMCNARDCDNCEVNYAQGNIREQKEWLRLAINALRETTGEWVRRCWDGLYYCSKCGKSSHTKDNYCSRCGAFMEKK